MVDVALWWTGDLSRVYSASSPMNAGTGSSNPELEQAGIENEWMNDNTWRMLLQIILQYDKTNNS